MGAVAKNWSRRQKKVSRVRWYSNKASDVLFVTPENATEAIAPPSQRQALVDRVALVPDDGELPDLRGES